MSEKKTAKENAEIAVNLWKSGKKPKEISEIMGLSRDYTLWLLSLSEDYRNRPNEYELREARVKEYYKSGKSVKEIAEIEGKSKGQIYAIVDRLGLLPSMMDNKPLRVMPDGWDWKWAVVTNRVLRGMHKPTHPVPAHSMKAEKEFWEAK